MTLQSSFIQMEQLQLDQLWKMTKMALVQSASMMEGSLQTVVEFHSVSGEIQKIYGFK